MKREREIDRRVVGAEKEEIQKKNEKKGKTQKKDIYRPALAAQKQQQRPFTSSVEMSRRHFPIDLFIVKTWNNISLQRALIFSPGLPSYFLVVLTSVGVDGYAGGSGFNTSGTVNEILSIFRAKRQKRDERRDRE
ncbi:hypothetical protein V1478_008311 [Vespula squamosa]|uniref:Uncharacterized protein n=1 Tax=Vespula squamosa TaxID=30214 RepID=A0ABD2AYF5_VESSQ